MLSLDLRADLSENSFASGRVMPLMHGGVLRSNVEIAQPPLKRRAVDTALPPASAKQASTTRTQVEATQIPVCAPWIRSASFFSVLASA